MALSPCSGRWLMESYLLPPEMKAFLPLGWKPECDVRSLVDVGWIIDTRT
jgi:hypothetical protein